MSLTHTPKFMCRFDNKNSFITNYHANIYGFKIGVDFDETFKIGGGFHVLEGTRTGYKIIETPGIANDTVAKRLRMYYLGYFAEYVFYRSKKWEFDLPMLIGYGFARYEYTHNGRLQSENNSMIILYETCVEGQYRFLKYFGLGAGVGYRLVLYKSSQIKERLTAPIYVVSLKIFFGDLYRAVFKKKEK